MLTFSDIPLLNPNDSKTGCCPEFQPDRWDGKYFLLDHEQFARASSRSFLYMPLNLGSVMTRAQAKIVKAHADYKDRYLILSQDETPWRCQHYFWVSKAVEGLESASILGPLYAKVYEGSYEQIPKWIKDLKSVVTANGHTLKDIFVFYTTCPKCAKVYGKNYIVLFARIEDVDKA